MVDTGCTLTCEYLREFSRGLGEYNSWKNLKQKIPWHCPFKLFTPKIVIITFRAGGARGLRGVRSVQRPWRAPSVNLDFLFPILFSYQYIFLCWAMVSPTEAQQFLPCIICRHTANKFRFMYSNCAQFSHSCVCERSMYSHHRSTYFPAAE